MKHTPGEGSKCDQIKRLAEVGLIALFAVTRVRHKLKIADEKSR